MSHGVVKVVTDALRLEGKQWLDVHDRLEPIIRAVDGLDLYQTAFWIGEPAEINAQLNSSTYNDLQNAVLKSFKAAAVEFEQINRVLRKIADMYDHQDSVAELDMHKAYTLP